MCIRRQFFNILHTIASRRTRAKSWTADIQCISAMVNGFDTKFEVFGRGQQF
jgi:hypothetical protein